jgi:hypothetical protein
VTIAERFCLRDVQWAVFLGAEMKQKSTSQKLLALLRGYGPSDLAELDAEIARARHEVRRLEHLRAVVGGGAAPPRIGTSPVTHEASVEPTSVVAEADKPALRREIVKMLKEAGLKRIDRIAVELEVTKEVALDLLAHAWFAKSGSNGQFTLSSDGHVEANRLLERTER